MASRICPRCGQEAPGTARFCSHCSAPLSIDPTTTVQPPLRTGETKLQAAANKSKVILISSLAAAVVVLGVVSVYALGRSSSVLHAAPPVSAPAPPVIQAPQISQPAAPVLQAPTTAAPAAPILQANTPAAAATPQDVLNYLNFVQQMEQQRTALEADQTAAILPLLGTAQGMKDDAADDDGTSRQTGANQINQGMTDNLTKWQNLVKTFQQQTPPVGCEDLGNAYYKLLQAYTDLCSQIQVALANGDYAKVLSLQSAQTIVDQDASDADSALATVCTRFNAKKSFVISTDSGSSGTSLIGG